ncbi:MAG: hypothetical protein WCF94_01145 [bacterium]
MLAIQKRQQIVPKKVILPNGTEAWAMFLVCEENGELTAKLISVRPIGDIKETVLAIAGTVAKVLVEVKKAICGEGQLSPFKDFSFMTEQLTRAPSLL